MRAYYSENNKYAAQFLRNLIDAGHIAPGDVDERSIVDVSPDDLRGYGQCHFFAGIGIWSASLRGSGIGDDEPVWTGSCPCQPFSAAGQGKGFADERHLWPAFHHLIKECGPAIVLGEQVASKDGLQWLDLVQDDMEGTGYAFAAADTCAAGACVDFAERMEGTATVEWISGAILSCPDPFLAAELRDFAAWARTEIGVGPAHIRQRLYWMAHADGGNASAEGLFRSRQHGFQPQDGGVGDRSDSAIELADTVLAGWPKGRSLAGNRSPAGVRAVGELGDASRDGQRQSRIADQGARPQEPIRGSSLFGSPRELGDPHDARSQGRRIYRNGTDELSARPPSVAGSDWIICTDGKARPTQPGILPLAHGYPGRVGLLRAAGNALNKAQAEQFIACAFEAIGRANNDL